MLVEEVLREPVERGVNDVERLVVARELLDDVREPAEVVVVRRLPTDEKPLL